MPYFKETWRDVRQHWRAMALPFGLMLAALTYVDWRLLMGWEAYSSQELAFGPTWLEALNAVLFLLSLPLIGVSWHRLVILGERPSLRRLIGGARRLFHYLWALVPVTFAVLAAVLPLTAAIYVFAWVLTASVPLQPLGDSGLPSSLSGLTLLPQLFVFLVLAVGSFVFLRFGLALPSVSVGRGRMKLADSRRLTEPMRRGLLGTSVMLALTYMLLTILPLWIENVGLELTGDAPRSALHLALISAVWTGSDLIVTFLNAAVQTRIYLSAAVPDDLADVFE